MSTIFYHKDGNFYSQASAPSGSYAVTKEQYDILWEKIYEGGVLDWYSNQRPYVKRELCSPRANVSNIGNFSYPWTHGVISGAASSISGTNYPGNAISGNLPGTSNNSYGGWKTNNSQAGWWVMYLPVEIILTKLTYLKPYDQTQSMANTTGRFWTSAAMTTPIGAQFSSNGAAWTETVVFDDTINPIRTNTIYFYKTAPSANYGGIGQIYLEGYTIEYEVPYTPPAQLYGRQCYVLGATNKYPWAQKDGRFYKSEAAPEGAYKLTVTEYYDLLDAINQGGTLQWYADQRPYVDKWTPWVQPVMTSDSFISSLANYSTYASSVNANHPAYMALDGLVSGAQSGWESSNVVNCYWSFTSTINLFIEKLVYYKGTPGNTSTTNITGRFYTSSGMNTPIGQQFTNNGDAWSKTVIYDDPVNAIMTKQIYLNKTGGGGWGGIGELEITAKYYTLLYEVQQR